MYDKNAEIVNCTRVKGLLVLFIILYHSMIVFASKSWFRVPEHPSMVLGVIAQFLNSFHIYTFTFISGYIYYYIRNEEDRYNNITIFIVNKIKRLIIPYIFVTLVWVIPVYVYFFDVTSEDIIVKFLVADSPEQLWFLLMLFWVFIIYHVLSPYINLHYIIGTEMIFMLYFVGAVWDFTLDYFQIFKGMQFILFFHLGFCWRKFGEKWGNKIYQIPSIILVVGQVILFVLSVYIGRLNHNFIIKIMDLGVSSTLTHTYGSISCFIVFQKIVAQKCMKNNRFLTIVSKNGMCMYLFHQQIIYFVLAIVMNRIPSIVMVAITFVVTTGVSLVVSMILTRFRVTRLLVGEK